MIKPTVGRIVWYNPIPKDNLELLMPEKEHGVEKANHPREQPLAAIVVAVHSDTRINILAFSAYGQTRFFPRVELYQGEGDRPKGHGYCEWMPFQIGQSKKTEELEKQLHQTQASGPPAPRDKNRESPDNTASS